MDRKARRSNYPDPTWLNYNSLFGNHCNSGKFYSIIFKLTLGSWAWQDKAVCTDFSDANSPHSRWGGFTLMHLDAPAQISNDMLCQGGIRWQKLLDTFIKVSPTVQNSGWKLKWRSFFLGIVRCWRKLTLSPKIFKFLSLPLFVNNF